MQQAILSYCAEKHMSCMRIDMTAADSRGNFDFHRKTAISDCSARQIHQLNNLLMQPEKRNNASHHCCICTAALGYRMS